MGKKYVLTEDEIVSYIKKSNLTNILVEGPNDLQIYNWIEEKIDRLNVRILPCGGRNTLIKIFRRRNEFSNKKVVFIADKDMWVYSEIPERYTDIIFTTGYSVENDLYSCSTNTIYDLFSDREKSDFEEIISSLLLWYCYEIEMFKKNKDFNLNISLHLNQVIHSDSTSLAPHYLAKINNYEPCTKTLNELSINNMIKLRGKFIFDAIIRQLSSKQRRSKFSRDNVFELCLKMNENHHFERIIDEINTRIK